MPSLHAHLTTLAVYYSPQGGEVDFGEFYTWWCSDGAKKAIPIPVSSAGDFDIMPIANVRGVPGWGKGGGVLPISQTDDSQL